MFGVRFRICYCDVVVGGMLLYWFMYIILYECVFLCGDLYMYLS